MTLSKENKTALFELVQCCDTKDDISYLRMLLGLREKELDASSPKGMSSNQPFWKR